MHLKQAGISEQVDSRLPEEDAPAWRTRAALHGASFQLARIAWEYGTLEGQGIESWDGGQEVLSQVRISAGWHALRYPEGRAHLQPHYPRANSRRTSWSISNLTRRS